MNKNLIAGLFVAAILAGAVIPTPALARNNNNAALNALAMQMYVQQQQTQQQEALLAQQQAAAQQAYAQANWQAIQAQAVQNNPACSRWSSLTSSYYPTSWTNQANRYWHELRRHHNLNQNFNQYGWRR